MGERDLLITNRFIYEPYFAGLPAPGMTVFQEDFGKGEPSDEMVEAICRRIGGFAYDRVIAVGGGTVHDIVRYCARHRGLKFISVPTAASCDGFCSTVAAMTWEGYKNTMNCVAPELVVADLAVIKEAPQYIRAKVPSFHLSRFSLQYHNNVEIIAANSAINNVITFLFSIPFCLL